MAFLRAWSQKTLGILNSVTAGLHFIWAFIFIILWGVTKDGDGDRHDQVYPLYSSFAMWADPQITTGSNGESIMYPHIVDAECDVPKALDFGPHMQVTPGWKDSKSSISLHWLVVTFFALSGLFQTVSAVMGLAGGSNASSPTLRFIEYSITSSIMIVAIALQVGIMDAHTLALLATLIWAMMMCSLVCEKGRAAKKILTDVMQSAHHNNKKNDGQVYSHSEFGESLDEYDEEKKVSGALTKAVYITHFIGWALLSVTFYVIIGTFHGSQKSCDAPGSAPNFVWAIVYSQAVLFSSFLLVQMIEIGEAVHWTQAEMAYILLSFVSKTLLGWLIYGGNFA